MVTDFPRLTLSFLQEKPLRRPVCSSSLPFPCNDDIAFSMLCPKKHRSAAGSPKERTCPQNIYVSNKQLLVVWREGGGSLLNPGTPESLAGSLHVTPCSVAEAAAGPFPPTPWLLVGTHPLGLPTWQQTLARRSICSSQVFLTPVLASPSATDTSCPGAQAGLWLVDAPLRTQVGQNQA